MALTLADYLKKRYIAALEEEDSAEKKLISEVLTLNVAQLTYSKSWLTALSNNIYKLKKDIEIYMSTDEFYEFVKANLEHFKHHSQHYWVKEVVMKNHISRHGDFKALYYNFVQ